MWASARSSRAVSTAQGSGFAPDVNTIQSITFGGAGSTVTGGTFLLTVVNPNTNNTGSGTGTPTTATTGPITYSTSSAVLQSNIQTALNALTAVVGSGGAVVSAVSATSVNVTFSGSLVSLESIPTMTDAPTLQGSSPSMAITTTVIGVPTTAGVG